MSEQLSFVLAATKQCNMCLQEKIVEEFFRNSRSPDGLRNQCKACTKIIRVNRDNRQTKPTPAPDAPRTCSLCKVTKTAADFWKKPGVGDGVSRRCKTCAAAQTKAWEKRNPDRRREFSRETSRKRRLAAKNVTPELYNKILTYQREGCALCGGVHEKRRLTVDVDPINNKVRGLLCTKCKKKVAGLDADPAKAIVIAREVSNEAVAKVASYIIRPQLWDAGILDD